jgi:hypothetical protein
MPRPSPRKLLVEGDEEKRVIPYFMDEHVLWGNKQDEWAVSISEFGGVDELLKPGNIEAESKVPGLRAMGIVVDADDHFDSRWARVRERCRRVIDSFPEELPPEGLIYETPHGLRIGVWIMPDNQSRGMLETFLSYLLAEDMNPLWEFACQSGKESKNHGASYSESHCDKVSIHTYLAWLDPPGRQLHVAVLARALDARLPLGDRFVRWFMDLFQLTPRIEPLP